ncbi:MAG: sodium:solute symporter [Halofilum sp. (in: g-proteobacteria)]
MADWLLPGAFWGFLILYGATMYLVSPRATTAASFYTGADGHGRAIGTVPLTLSIFISWIFAKSVTNAANLGAEYGAVGAIAYATYWLSIPVAGFVIFYLRRRFAATSLAGFLASRYGRAAAIAFTVAVLVRLYNEIWSNTAVVGGYFGEPGSTAFIGAALVFTLATLAYSIKGGLRGSIVTDVIQSAVFVGFVALLLFWVMPQHGTGRLLATGEWRLGAGLDLLLVAGLQVFSYPFHDPVLTDRAFLNHERRMLTAFIVAGVLGFVAIAAFGLVGAHASLEGVSGSNVPAAVARSFGIAALFAMSVVMMSSAGSTLDSAFSSLARSLAWDLPALGRHVGDADKRVGVAVMIVFAILGNLPMLAGTEILKATTLSGTMVIGLAPVFIFGGVQRHAVNFHLSFWSGMTLGALLAAGWLPAWLAIGDGDYALLLGTNVWGLMLCTALFWLPLRAEGEAVASAETT